MGSPQEFGLATARTPDERMSELEKFIVFWLGPRLRKFGESEAVLDRMKLPVPLRRLYAFAGRWGRNGRTGSVFANQDGLKLASEVAYKDGKVVFVVENSGNWEAATSTAEDDPPVWVNDQWIRGYGQGKWVLVSSSLSQFLATFCMQELMFGSRLCVAEDNNLIERWKTRRKEAIPLITGPYPYMSVDSTFRLLHGHVLVGEMDCGTWFGANHEKGMQILRELQGR